MEGKRKVILIVITVALLLALIPLVTNNNFMTVATPTPQQSATQTTPKQPTIDNLTQQYLSVSLSAIENSTDVTASSTFNEPYFNLPDPTSLPGVLAAQVGIQAHILRDGLNLTAPHTSYLFGPYGSMFFGPFGFSSLNQTMGVVMVQINESDVDACNQMLQLISEEFIREASSIGIDLRPVATQVYPMFYPALPNQVTMGLSIMTSLNDSATAYDILESLIPEGCLAKTIATKPSDERYIVLTHFPAGTSWTSWVQVGMVIENQTVKNGDTYTYSLRTLLEPSNNITIKGPATISVNLPATSKIMSTYGFYQGWGVTQPSVSYSNYSGDVNIEDLNVTYTLESSVPYVVAEYDVSDWNMNPGDTGKLYLTLRNVGTSAAYNISGSVYNLYPQIINFTGAPWGPSSWASFYIDEIGVGDSIVLEFDFEAGSPGKSTIHIGYNWRRDPNGLTIYNSWLQFDFKIGIPGPLLVTSTGYSDWVLNPNDAVSAITTIRNVGNEDATNVTVMGIPIGPALGTVIDSNVTLPGFDNPIMSVGDISAGSSFTMNVTYRNDMGFFGSVHTGGSVGLAGFQLLYDGTFSQGIISLPLLLPGVRPPEAIYFEFEKTPEVVSVEPGDQVTVSVKLKNLGLTEQPFFVTDLYPEDVFELVDGYTMIGGTIESGEVVTMTYTLNATTSATLRLPPPAIGSNYTWVLTAEKILGAPIEADTSPPTTMIVLSGDSGFEGWYVSDVTVNLSAADDFSGVAQIAYSFDGSTWYNYTGPFDITAEGVTTLYYNSTDNAGNVEETKTELIMIDKTSPETSVSLSGDLDPAGWYLSEVTVNLTAVDGVSGVAKTEYSYNGTVWFDYTGPFTVAEDGVTTIYYRSTDVAGNVEEAKTVDVRIDLPDVVVCVNGSFHVNATAEAGVEIFGNTSIPARIEIWGYVAPPASPPEDVIPLSFIRIKCNESFAARLVFHYTDSDLPANVSEEDLAVYRWDEVSSSWVELPGVVDTEANTITVEVSGLGYFMLGVKAAPEEVFHGFGVLRIDGQWYIGEGVLTLSESDVKIEISNQSANWTIESQCERWNIEFYKGNGDLGRITLIVYRGETSSYVIAIGRGVFFYGHT
ncbi:MAG: OmpL47-type beta-barrel domain-containing protein [Candidatus Freyarchaeota archaeon]